MRFVSDEVRDPIWKRVLALAMRIEYYEENVHSQEFRIDTKLTASTALARLCCWYRGLSRLPPSFSPLLRAQRLGLPYLYGYPILCPKCLLEPTLRGSLPRIIPTLPICRYPSGNTGCSIISFQLSPVFLVLFD